MNHLLSGKGTELFQIQGTLFYITVTFIDKNLSTSAVRLCVERFAKKVPKQLPISSSAGYPGGERV